jgi:apolipoprotein N-acyltransferase
MNLSRPTRLLLALGSGAALGLAFPNYNLWPLAWIAIAMLLLASLGARPGEAALYGFLHGVVFYPTCLPWIDTVMQQYGNVDRWNSAGILGLIGIAGGIICAILTVAVAGLGKKSAARACLLAPFLWVALEFLRTHLPIIGFPWNLTGYAAERGLAFLQLAAWTGIYGLSFLIAAFNALLAWSLVNRTRRSRITLVFAVAFLIIVGTVGSYLVPRQQPRYVAHLVQTNFPQSQHYPPDWADIHAGELAELARLSIEAAHSSPGLIVWPEVPAPFSLQDSKFAALAKRIAQESGQDFLVGVVDWKQDARGNWLASNSAVLLDRSGQWVSTYDKIHLVPFGEYVPLRRWIKFARRLTADISDFTPGSIYSVGKISGGRFGSFICYEAIFPAEVRRFAAGGAELLINISNDGWFGRSSAPAQHLMMARVRAVEGRRWLLRDTNNGYTVSVDPYGRIVARLPTDIRAELDAPYDFRSDLTPYVRWGDWFAWLCVAASVLLAGAAIVKRA